MTSECDNRVSHEAPVPVRHTYGRPLAVYPDICLSNDWTAKAFRSLYTFRPDVIHASTPGPLLIPSILVAYLLDIPLMLSCHTHMTAYVQAYAPRFLQSVAHWFVWRFMQCIHFWADVTLVTSPQIQGQFAGEGITNVHVWKRGVDSDLFHPSHSSVSMRFNMTAGKPSKRLLVYIGRLATEKRIDLLRDILEHLPSQDDPILCIVGTGPQERELHRYFEGNNTVFLGQLHDKQLSQAFASGDVFVMPSTSETLGFVVLESMASGVPVVAANAGGLKHIVRHESTGFLVKPDNAEAFASTVAKLFEEPDLHHRIAAAARQEVQLLSWTKSMGTIREQIYPLAHHNFENRCSIRLKRWLHGT